MNARNHAIVILLSVAFFILALFPSTILRFSCSHAASNSLKPANIVFILDASGSMRGHIGSRTKIDIAKNVLSKLIQELPAGINVGLVAYGHRRKGDCNDVEELVPLGNLNKKVLISKIRTIKPKGKTPISYSVELTAEKLQNLEEKTTIVLVSDGKETCGGDPCQLVRKLKESGIKFIIHVIGFDVTAEEKKQLECIAKAGGGTYYTARNANQFLHAMRKVVSKPEFEGGILKVTAVKDGKPFSATVTVYKQGEEDSLIWNDTHPPEPYTVKLLPGVYDIEVKDENAPENPAVKFKGIEIKSGATRSLTTNF